MIRNLVISNRAEADLREIWSWTYRRFGEAQADRYLDELGDGLQRCEAEPERGKNRSTVRPVYWSQLVRHHLVFYTFTQREVVIQRVLHGRMDPVRHV